MPQFRSSAGLLQPQTIACSLALVLGIPGCGVDGDSTMDGPGPGPGSGPGVDSANDTEGGPEGETTDAPGEGTEGETGNVTVDDSADETGSETSDDDTGPSPMGDTPVEWYGDLHVADGRLRDADGNPVQLRGVSSMWLNWEDDGYAENLDALRWMRDNWGLSVIRAAMGVEPDGAYLSNPDKALAQVRTIVDNAIASGVYVIIDWHDHDAHVHQGQAVEFFRGMAMEYGDTPNVLYEPYNEPLQVSWSGVIKPYHQAVVSAIREIDPDNVIILGTPNWSQYVHEAAMDPLQGTNLMYTLHFYSCTHTNQIREWADTAMGAGLALFVTEWAATHADGGLDGLLCLDEANVWHDWMNAHDVSWTAWKLDNCQPDSSCMLNQGASVEGGWGPGDLRGHGPFVQERMQAGQ